ncbi:MAG TPA: serine/threonine-protein kinase [Solirubrobacter sp.]
MIDVGSVVAGHRVLRLVGRGGMGVVYEAVEESLGRTVALKLVAPDRADEPGFRERFIAESRLAASIDHPNVLPVFKAGEEDGLLYLAMRFVDGADLRTMAPLEPMRAAHIVAQVGAALDAAHARRLVHRDVKPANVLIAAGDHAYLTDFGLVKALDETAGQTRTGNLVGTLDYVAPERIRGEGDGRASDLYSLGCVLYYTLTGAVPFPLEGTERKLWAHLSEPPPTVGSAFDEVIGRAMAKDPGARFESGAALGMAAIAAAGGSRPSPVLLDAARRCERGIRVAAPELAAQAAELVAAFEHAAVRAALLREALADAPPERVERRLADVRAGQDPGKAKLVAALAQHLAVQRKMQTALAGFDADTERILLELETVRGRVLADDTAAGERLASLQDEIETIADRLDRAGGESAT